MKRKTAIYIMVCAALAMGLAAAAQNTVYYSCDFENSAENSQWVLNKAVPNMASRLVNKWYIGPAGNYGSTGNGGLFVSNDGIHNTYTGTSLTVCAYRELPLLPAGDYLISFDWNALGAGHGDMLYACWMDASTTTNSGVMPSIPNVYRAAAFDSITGASGWQVANNIIHSDGVTQYKLMFSWFNRQTADAVNPPGIVDNIVIRDVPTCKAPTNLSHVAANNGVTLKWNGNAESYDVRMYNNYTGDWSDATGLTGKSYTVSDVSEGVWTFYVRSHCGDEYSVWESYTAFVWMLGQRCVEYLDLTNRNCYYGTFTNPRTSSGKVDHGYASIQSRHTLHYMPNEYDIRTGNRLRTIPDGEIASVRLGNWDTGSQGESVTYQYAVTSASGIMKLKYAVVLQDPKHEEAIQPRFTLEILNGTRPISSYGCGQADFRAGLGDMTGWHYTDDGSIVWKEWTEVSVNLRDWVGKTLTIRLTTYDCNAGGHYGYAYFTIGCESGELEGMNCMAPTTRFEAPSGFNYRWFTWSNESNTLSTSQVFSVDKMDTVTYLCDVISKTNDKCYYTLVASSLPRIPVPEATWETSASNCENLVKFTNTSHVITVNQVNYDTTKTSIRLGNVLWDFGDGTVASNISREVSHYFPREGGTYAIKQTAVLDSCEVTTTYNITLPNLDTRVEENNVHICNGDTYQWTDHTGRTVFLGSDFADTLYTQSAVTGCDSIYIFNLSVGDTTVTQLYDTICSDSRYVFYGDTLTRAGTYDHKLLNMYGCDSLMRLNLYVVDMSEGFHVSGDAVGCYGDANITVEVSLPTVFDSLYLHFDDRLLEAGAVETSVKNPGGSFLFDVPLGQLGPGRYEARLEGYNRFCGWQGRILAFEVRYPSTVMQQKWNDAIGVKNADYNGGWQFVGFQWYKDDVPLLGETRSYIYVPDTLSFGASYSVMLTDTAGRQIMSCPIQATPHTDITAYPTLIDAGGLQPVIVRTPAPAQAVVYTAMGTPVARHQLQRGTNTLLLNLPSGAYLLRITPTAAANNTSAGASATATSTNNTAAPAANNIAAAPKSFHLMVK